MRDKKERDYNFEFVRFAYSGDANIAELDLSGGEVKLDTAGNTVNYNGAFTGTGSLTKIGSGVLNFASNKTIGGRMTIREGSLAIASSLSLTTNGGLSFAAGSSFTPNGNTLTVTGGGVAISDGTRLNLADIDIGKTVLAASAGISGKFDISSMFYGTEMNAALTELRVTGELASDEKAQNIISNLANSGVTVGKNGAKGIGQLAGILGSVAPDVEAELMRQLEELVDLADSGDRAAAAAGVQQIIGSYSTRATQATHTVAQSFGGAVSGHLAQMRDMRTAMREAPVRGSRAYASLRDPARPSYSRSARGGYASRGYSPAANRIWTAGFGSFANQGDRDGEFGYDYAAGGFILGYDHYFGDSITVGVSGAYSHGRLDGNEGLSVTDMDTLNVGVYASYDANNGFYAEGNLGLEPIPLGTVMLIFCPAVKMLGNATRQCETLVRSVNEADWPSGGK